MNNPMNHLKFYFEELATKQLKTNENANGTTTIQQTQRNLERIKLIENFYQDLIENDFNTYITNDGIILAIDNEEIGTVSIELKLTFKSLDYDPEAEADAYEEQQTDKAHQKELRAKAKAIKIVSDTKMRAKKALEDAAK